MSDVKDILGMSRPAGTPGEKQEPVPKPKKERMKRPEGMSREAFALLGDSHPIISTQLVPKKQELKAKPKPSTKGFVTWTYKPIMTSARTDDLKLLHWAKGYKDAAGRMKEDEETDSYFAKFNKKVQLMKYNDEEYNNLIRPGDKDWTRKETDYLLDMCERFDLRFIVIADRYEFTPPPGAPQRAPPPARSVDDLKERYYYIAQRLLEAREAGKAAVSNHILVRHPFDKNHELERKKAIELLLQRTKQQTEEDNAILAEARLIEERLKAEAKPKQTAGAAGAGSAANNAMSNAAAAAAALAMGEITFPESFSNDAGPGQPSLFNAALEPSKPPKPGVYGRAMHALNLSNSLVASMPGGVKAQKALEAVLSDSSWGPAASAPRCGTRAVCGAWLALRLELMALQELRRVALPSRGPAAGADAGARQKRKK